PRVRERGGQPGARREAGEGRRQDDDNAARTDRRARGTARRKDVRPHRHARDDDARGSHGAPGAPRCKSGEIGQQEDGGRCLRPGRRKQTGESAGAGRGNLGRAAVPGEYNQGLMSRRFTFVTLVLTAVVAFLVGAIVAGGAWRSEVAAGASPKAAAAVRPA